MTYAAIDYSLSNPAMVVYDDTASTEPWFYFLSKNKKSLIATDFLYGELTPTTVSVSRDIADERVGSSLARFEAIARFFHTRIQTHGVSMVFLEGYALGARGKVFSIAENTAVLKFILWRSGIDVRIFAPTTVKKFATGKGNSGKQEMRRAFEQSSTAPVHVLSPIAGFSESPYTDCVDAWWILSYGLDTIQQNGV